MTMVKSSALAESWSVKMGRIIVLAWADRALRRSFWETKDHQLTEQKCLN